MKSVVGSKFGRLTVLSYHHKDIKYRSFWLCVCDCGNSKVIRIDHLKTGTVSCGCRKKESASVMEKYRKYKGSHKKLDDSQVCLNWLFRNYKAGAISRGMVFSLSISEFSKITKELCFYCGTKPKQIIKAKRYPKGYIYNGIDRVNNAKGYTKNNVVACCGKCNFAKNKMNRKDFLLLVKNIYLNQLKRE